MASNDHFDDLLARARDGDGIALVELMERCRPAITRGVIDGAAEGIDWADAAADARLAIVESFDTFRGVQVQICQWMKSIARRKAIDMSRRYLREQPTLDGGSLAAKVHLRAAATNPADLAIESALLHRLLTWLPPDEAELLLVHYIAGVGTAELAEEKFYNQQALRRKINKILAKSARYLNGEPT